ncbi:DUF2800 domain-containing protein [Lentisphaerota bacterium WC36G]|nr:DUF2800 domain-containing protein [Lentisphaerae bacterium WC36]
MPNEIHHINSPSSLERRKLCPGSMKIEQALPEPPQSEYAAEGTMLHEAVATNNLELCETDEQYEMARNCLNFVDELATSQDEVYKEVSLELLGSDWEIVTFGTADVVINGADKLIVIDWKFGRNPVQYAKDNIQLATYATMAMQQFKKKECTVFIVQPRCGRWNDFYTFSEPANILANIESIIEKCNDPAAEAVPGESQCKYCRGQYHLSCKAIQNEVEVFIDEELPTIEEKINELSNDDLAKIYAKCKAIANFQKKIEYRIKKECESNQVCGNLILKKSSGGREIKDITALYNAVADVITQGEFLKLCSCSVAKIEKLYAVKKKEDGTYKTQKDGIAEFNGKVEDLIKFKADRVSILEVK